MGFRFRCFSLHLMASLVTALIAISLVFGLWYRPPLYTAVGVTTVFLILLGVDVVLGPLLTLLVAKEKKRTIKFDLGIIIALQLSAFIYGMSVVASGRPVWIVFSGDRFDLVQSYQLDESSLKNAATEYQARSMTGPNWIATQLPDDVDERNALTFESVLGGSDLPQRPNLYVPYESKLESAKQVALPLNNLNKYNAPQKVSNVLREWPEANAYLPMMARAKPMTVLMRRDTGQVLGIVPLNPW